MRLINKRFLLLVQCLIVEHRHVPLIRYAPRFILAAALILSTAQSGWARLHDTRQLTSNNIVALAGSGDTLWAATERGFNYTTSIHTIRPQDGWPGFQDNDLLHRFRGLAFGNGNAAALVYRGGRSEEIGFWRFNHADGRQHQVFFQFPSGVRGENGDLADPTGHMVYAHGNFWASFNHGGAVMYDPADNSLFAIRPGDTAKVHPGNLTPLSGNDSAKIVTAVGVSQNGDLILITAASTYWIFDNNGWSEIDTLPPNPIYDAIDSTDFRPMLAAAGDIVNPDINDKLFMPREDGTGTLAIATTTGLYLCKSADPAAAVYGDFELIRYIREVRTREAYALPGVIRGGADGRYNKAVFVYRLKKDGDVTIRVYDYRMSLVKTVIRDERRYARERSTDPLRDFWDGTNRSGRAASPGVYYFKITSTGGDRHFGKVILAK